MAGSEPAPDRSCFVEKLSYYTELSPSDREMIAEFERNEEKFAARRRVLHAKQDRSRLFILASGWAYSWTQLADGRRQVENIHLPGDMIGMRDSAARQATTNLSTLTDCTFCPFEKEGLAPVFEDAPRLAALIYTLTLLESMIFADRLRAVARMRGEERLAHFILQVQSRLRITNPNIGTRFRFPFTQELVGDCIGLSQVYVNRTFQSLIDRDYIRRVRNEIEIRDEDGMRKLCDFEDRYYDFDAGWLPGSVARATHADTLSEAAE